MVFKRPLQIFNGFWGDHHHWMFLGSLTIAINGFTMVFWCCYHRFQWFSIVPDHWSNDAMVSMDRCGLHWLHVSSFAFGLDCLLFIPSILDDFELLINMKASFFVSNHSKYSGACTAKTFFREIEPKTSAEWLEIQHEWWICSYDL